MSNSYTETSYTSWGARLRNAVSGVLLAPLALLGGAGLLFWNEGNVVRTAQSLDEGEKQVVEVPAEKIDDANSGKLIYVTGETAVQGTLQDPLLGISEPAIKLQRVVEMYQWTEEKKTRTKNNRTDTTYEYERKWRETKINSRSFHRSGYDNPEYMPLQSHQEIADQVTLGAFQLTDLQIAQTDQAGNRHTRKVTPEEFAAMPEEIRRDADLSNHSLYMPVARWLPHAPPDQLNPKFTPSPAASDESNPQVGDVRLKFQVVKPGPTSVVGRQTKTGFEPFPTKAGKTVFLFRTEKLTPHEMFEKARADNTMWAWILRGVGLMIIFVGFLALTGPLRVLGDWIPLVGSLVSGGMFLLALAGTVVCGSLIIAVAWLFYRPVLAIAALLVALALAVALWFLFRRKPPAVHHASGLEIVS